MNLTRRIMRGCWLAAALVGLVSLSHASTSGGTYAIPTATLNNGVATMTGSTTYRLTSSLGDSFGSSAMTGSGYALHPGFTSEGVALGSTVTLGSSVNPSVQSQSITLTATVSGAAPTGTVAFVSDGVTIATCAAVSLSSASAQCSISSLTSGNHNLTAIYGGDGFNASATSATLVQVVTPRQASTTTLLANLNPVLTGQMVTLTAQVSGSAGTATGNIVFKDGTTTLATTALTAGSASFISNAFASGSHSLSADYAGDSAYQSSQGLLSLEVSSMIATTTTLSTTPNPSQIGANVTATVSVTPAMGGGTPTGAVSVSGGGQNCTITLPAVSCVLAFTTRGSKALTATYSGNGSFATSSGTATHRVGRQPDLTPILMLLLD
jgi:hypothetical protein